MGYGIDLTNFLNNIFLLSIPFMGYKNCPNILNKKGKNIFQFPLWDTALKYYDSGLNAHFFQFPLWDTIQLMQNLMK